MKKTRDPSAVNARPGGVARGTRDCARIPTVDVHLATATIQSVLATAMVIVTQHRSSRGTENHVTAVSGNIRLRVTTNPLHTGVEVLFQGTEAWAGTDAAEIAIAPKIDVLLGLRSTF